MMLFALCETDAKPMASKDQKVLLHLILIIYI